MTILEPANLVAWAVQAAVVVVVAAPLPRLLRVWSPRVRMAYWRAVLIACLVLPLVQPWVVSRPSPAVAAGSPAVVVDVIEARETAHGPTPSITGTVAAPARRLRWPTFGITGILAAGAVLRLGWLALGVLTVRRLRRAAQPLWPRPAAVDRAAGLAETDAEFLLSATASRPVTWGLLWPVVIVPRNFESIPEPEQTAIACHELLHVARADWARNTVDEILRALLWFHPAAWWLVDQIQLAREQVVDREAVRRLGSRQPYLEALLRMARPAPRLVLSPASLFLKRAHLRQRVTLLVKETTMSRTRIIASVATMAVVLVVTGRLASASFPLQLATGSGTEGRTGPMTRAAQEADRAVPRAIASVGEPAGAAASPGAPAAPGAEAPLPAATIPGEPRPQDGTRLAPWAVSVGEETATLVTRVLPETTGGLGLAKAVVEIDAAGNVSRTSFIAARGPAVPAVSDAAGRWVFAPSVRKERTTILGFNLDVPPPPPGTATLQVGGQAPPPQKVRDVAPSYPPEARDARLQGVQIFEVSIDPAGNVTDARVLRGTSSLAMAALDAVLQWKFTPWAGPEQRVMVVTVNFTLATSADQVWNEGESMALRSIEPAAGVPYGAPTDWPRDVVTVGGLIDPPTKLTNVQPVYPKAASDARVQGVVVLQVLIGPDGKIKAASVLQSIPMLDKAAYDAVLGWEFTPTLVNGTPASVAMTVTVSFTLQ